MGECPKSRASFYPTGTDIRHIVLFVSILGYPIFRVSCGGPAVPQHCPPILQYIDH